MKGEVGYYFMFAPFFQVVNRVCNFLKEMLHCMHILYPTACYCSTGIIALIKPNKMHDMMVKELDKKLAGVSVETYL